MPKDPARAARAVLNLDVPALEPAIRFYEAAFGARVGRRFDAEFVELLGLDMPIYLLVKPEGSAPAPGAEKRTYARHWTPLHLDLVVTDLDAALARAVAAGATVERPTTVEPYGRLALLADPFGHGFCLLELNERGYDAMIPGAP